LLAKSGHAGRDHRRGGHLGLVRAIADAV